MVNLFWIGDLFLIREGWDSKEVVKTNIERIT